MNRIVIIPTFASSHFLECWIDNVVEALNPTHIIINEGLFPAGPENKGHVDSPEFKEKYCYGNWCGFDYQLTARLILEKADKYPNVKIIFNIKEYTETDANRCFLEAISDGLDSVVNEGDIVFPLEPDAFLLESDANIINSEIDKLQIGQGLRCLWRDFLQNQYYCECINEQTPKLRRFCYRFDNMDNYLSAMDGFMTQNYLKLKYTDAFWVRHYPWFVNDKWRELRYDLIYRSNPQYWQDFQSGLELIDERSRTKAFTERVIIRPSRSDFGRWAQYIEVQHPKAIKKHKSFLNN